MPADIELDQMPNGSNKVIRLHMTIRDLIMLGTILVSFAAGYYALKGQVDSIKQAIAVHVENEEIHPSVLERQALIDQRVDLKMLVQEERWKRIEDKIDNMTQELRDHLTDARRPVNSIQK